ncbi:MAG TPA: ATP-binding protein [Syntrophorhabdaceae bacterium]|nr:ATP-binding protein [Syntrophorhabdaceae bacterium]
MSLKGHTYFISKKVGKAICDYKMLKDGDKVLIAISGGKDSLCLLKIMKERIKFVPVDYEIGACFVDMGFNWVQKEALIDFFEKESIPYIIADAPEEWKKDNGNFDCFWCSWNRRKSLFNAAHKYGYKKLALAHHMDDIVETMLINLFFQGEIGTMKPFQEMFNGELYIIRPLAYVEENELIRMYEQLNLPHIADRYPNSNSTKRKLIKDMIKELKKHNRNVKKNIFRSLKRIRQEYLL